LSNYIYIYLVLQFHVRQFHVRHFQSTPSYLMNAGKAFDDTEHNDGIAVRIVGDLNGHSVKQHLIESVGEQRLRQLAEEILQHAFDTHTHTDSMK